MIEVTVAQAIASLVIAIMFSIVIGMLVVILPLTEKPEEPPARKPKMERRKKAYKIPDFEYASKDPEKKGITAAPMNIVENNDNTRTGTTQTPAETERLGRTLE